MLKLPEYEPVAGKGVNPKALTGLPIRGTLAEEPEKARLLENLKSGVAVAE
jgi:hypothetical protein